MVFEKYFKGKRVIVTGASRGLGKGLVSKLHEYDSLVFAVAKNPERLAALKAEFPKIETRAVDLEDWDATRAAIQSIGPVDYLVNNAAVLDMDNFLDIKPESFDKLFNTNLKAVINVSQVVASGMIEAGKGGSIVNISSIAGKKHLARLSAYCASKGALEMLTQSMAFELGPHKIRVNSVNPGPLETDMYSSVCAEWLAKHKAGHLHFNPHEEFLTRSPLGRRFTRVEEVVNLVLFVLSEMAGMVHGAAVMSDGGMYCH